nr:hypothetical protein [Leptospira interrogans]
MKLKFFKIHFLFLNFMAGAVLRYHTHDIVETLEETAFQKLLQWLSDKKVQDFVNIQRSNGQICLTMSGLFNHRSALIIDIFKKISDIIARFLRASIYPG